MKKPYGFCRVVGVLVITVWHLAAVAQVGAEEMKWRQSMHIVKAESVQVGDVPDHIVGVAELAGLAFFESGDVATLSTKATIDYTNGSGLHQEYTLYHCCPS